MYVNKKSEKKKKKKRKENTKKWMRYDRHSHFDLWQDQVITNVDVQNLSTSRVLTRGVNLNRLMDKLLKRFRTRETTGGLKWTAKIP